MASRSASSRCLSSHWDCWRSISPARRGCSNGWCRSRIASSPRWSAQCSMGSCAGLVQESVAESRLRWSTDSARSRGPTPRRTSTEPLQTLSLVFAAYAVVRSRQSRSAVWLWLGGGGLALAILTKPVLVLAVPAFVLYVLSEGILDGERRSILETIRDAQWWRVAIARQATLLVPVLLGLAVTLWLNVVRFGSPLNFGYDGLGGDTELRVRRSGWACLACSSASIVD